MGLLLRGLFFSYMWEAAFPILIGRVNKWLESELVFDCDEVAAEMHISLVRYEQEIENDVS